MRYNGYPEYSEPVAEMGTPFPKEWNIERLRFSIESNPVKSEIGEMNRDELVTFVPMEAVGEYGGMDTTQEKPLGDVYSGYTYFKENDILVAKITPCFENGKGTIATGLKNDIGFGTTEFHVLRPLEGILTRWLFYLTLSDLFRRMGAAEMQGAGGQKRVPEHFIRDFRTGIPSLSEQNQIADFLDYKTAQIDALIAKKKELIEKLKEQRIAVITQAVTKGLDSNAPMRDSGVEWLGQVPEHWEVKRLKWAVMLQRGHDLPTEERVDGDVPIVTSSGISAYHDRAIAKAPGIVTGRYGTIGVFHLIEQDYWPLNTTLYSNDLHGNCPRFLRALLENIAPLFLLNSVKSAVPGVDRNDILSILVALPQPDEQGAIADYIDAQFLKIGRMIEKVEAAINRLTEYRAALITAATTGKIDVRNVKLGKAK
jgi:type I restriction enzyme, S subunit